MRLVAMVCALTILVCVGVFATILSQRDSVPLGSTSPVQTASTEGSARAVVTTIAEQGAPPAKESAAKPAFTSGVAPSNPTVGVRSSSTVAVAPTSAAPQVPAAAALPASPAPARAGSSCPGNPDALGVSRVVEIDTTGGPGFGFEHFKSHDFLREGEVVLTFDDGPWPKNTSAVLA